MKNLFFHLLVFFVFSIPVSVQAALVEDVFSDISKDYIYRDELQALYDRGMILPDASGKFSPSAYLNRDEFVGISMEVICERCIQPHTELKFLEKYQNADVYFDIDASNPYFYCVAEADARSYVRGYDLGEACQNGSGEFGERPFCPANRINLEEAIAVLLRNSNIFTIEDNQIIVDRIRAGVISQKLGNDVSPRDIDGNPYTFYGYLQKALSYEIIEYTPSGAEKKYKLLELDTSGNVNPKKQITKEEFLRMSYIALKSNSCGEVGGSEIALAIDIWEKSCTQGQNNCPISNLDDPDDTYDFTPEVEGFCEEGIDTPSGYTWRFFNENTREEFFEYGEYLDNIKLPSIGSWKVYLTVRDRCGNTATVYSTITVEPDVSDTGVDQEIDVDIDVFDDVCTGPVAGCREIEFESQEDDGDNIFDLDGDVDTTCPIGVINYNWTLKSPSGRKTSFTTEFIDNFDFSSEEGIWYVLLEVKDGCGQTGSEEMNYTVVQTPDEPEKPHIDVDIDVFDDPCSGVNQGCPLIEFESQEDDGDDIFDFDGDVDTSCKIGEIDYKWTFQKEGSTQKYNFYTEYVDNFEFLEAGVWSIVLEVADGCGQIGSEQMTYIVNKDTSLGLSVDIIANPIIGYAALKVDFEGIVYRGVAPYVYNWSFGDASIGAGKNIEHLYTQVNTYEVRLTVIDSKNQIATATTLIKVLDTDTCLQDSDGDGGNDCEDYCPLVPGVPENLWCPILETPCTDRRACAPGYICNYDSTLAGESGFCLPTFDPKSNCLYSPDVGSIFGSAVCLTCPCPAILDFLADLRKCDFVFPAITSPDAKNLYSQGRVWQVPSTQGQ